MNKKIILGIIIGVTALICIVLIGMNKSIRYSKIIVTESEWEQIKNSRIQKDLNIESIQMNDYSLIIDSKNHKIYYSKINSSKQYNPTVSYTGEGEIIAKEKLTKDKKNYEIMIYNDKYYQIYELVVTNLPTIQIETENENTSITIFDNHSDAFQKVIKTDGKVLEGRNGEIILSLRKESLGRNERDNQIPIFGMEPHHEYRLIKGEGKNSVELFINGEYQGVYSLTRKEERRRINE